MSTASTLGKAVLTAMLGNLETAALGPIITALQSVKANPQPLNIVAQVGLLKAQLIGALPNLEVAEVTSLATLGITEAQTLLAKAQANAAALNAPVQASAAAQQANAAAAAVHP